MKSLMIRYAKVGVLVALLTMMVSGCGAHSQNNSTVDPATEQSIIHAAQIKDAGGRGPSATAPGTAAPTHS